MMIRSGIGAAIDLTQMVNTKQKISDLAGSTALSAAWATINDPAALKANFVQICETIGEKIIRIKS